MIPTKDFPYIMVTISVCLILLGFARDMLFSKVAFIFLYILLILCSLGLSVTMYFKLSKTIELKDEQNLEIIQNTKMSGSEFADILHSITVLNKYSVTYTIDLLNKEIHATLPMSLYTRMSISNNIQNNVYYHITGTDIILFKKNNDTNVQ